MKGVKAVEKKTLLMKRLLFFLWFFLLPSSASAIEITEVRFTSKAVPCYSRLEISFLLKALYDNPFDPQQIAVSGVFTDPQGKKWVVPGFWYQPYQRSLKNQVEQVEPIGPGSWRIRFTPGRPGIWRCQILVRDKKDSLSKALGQFRVIPSQNPGFVRRSRRTPFFLSYENGKPFFLVGENLGWSGPRGTYDYEEWLRKLSRAGANFARIWMSQWDLGIEWTPGQGKGLFGGPGRYALDNAWRLDFILEEAQRRGIYLMFCLDTYGMLKADPGLLGEGAWKHHPYYRKNGGPCEKPQEFFTSPEAKRLYRNRLRYLVARYGWATHLLAWEFWNEVNLVSDYDPSKVLEWHREMSSYLKAIDPYRHLITTSYANLEGDFSVWRLPTIDFAQGHHYGDGSTPADSTPILVEISYRMTERLKKPYLIGEFGIDWRASDVRYDPKGVGVNFHNGLWAGLLGRAMGGGCIWWWDNYIHPLNLYHQFTPLAKWVKLLSWGKDQPQRFPAKVHPQEGPFRPADLKIYPAGGWGTLARQTYKILPDGTWTGGDLPAYLYGPAKGDWNKPVTLQIHLPREGSLKLGIGLVSAFSRLEVTVDGRKVFSKDFLTGPEGQGPWKQSRYLPEYGIYQCAYDTEINIPLPPGPHLISLHNTQGDWMTLRYILLEKIRDARYPPLELYTLGTPQRMLLWLHHKESHWQNALRDEIPPTLRGVKVEIPRLKRGRYRVLWWDTWKGETLREVRIFLSREPLLLVSPPFSRDVIVFIEKEE